MKVTTSAAAAASCLLSVSGALALQTSPLLSTKSTICTPLLASSMSGGEENGDQQIDESKLSKYSQAIPFLGRPKALKGQYAGDVGFDPLGFAQNEAQLEQYREAEIKHARLAMLAAAGWPISELFDRQIAAYFHLETALDSADRVPSLLNGGLGKVVPEFWGFCLGLCAAIDLEGVQKSQAPNRSPDYQPGDMEFDPLNLYPADKDGRRQMDLAEIKHGRLAMIAVLAFSVQEYVSKEGVVDETPFFFTPFTETLTGLFTQ